MLARLQAVFARQGSQERGAGIRRPVGLHAGRGPVDGRRLLGLGADLSSEDAGKCGLDQSPVLVGDVDGVADQVLPGQQVVDPVVEHGCGQPQLVGTHPACAYAVQVQCLAGIERQEALSRPRRRQIGQLGVEGRHRNTGAVDRCGGRDRVARRGGSTCGKDGEGGKTGRDALHGGDATGRNRTPPDGSGSRQAGRSTGSVSQPGRVRAAAPPGLVRTLRWRCPGRSGSSAGWPLPRTWLPGPTDGGAPRPRSGA